MAVQVVSPMQFKQNRMGFMMPSSFEEAKIVAATMVESGCIPDWHLAQKNPIASVMMCLQKGIEVGLTPTESLQKICRINGVLAIWGDAALGLCKIAPDYEYCHETYDPVTQTATCEVKRKGEPKPVIRTYSKEDAVKAGLWGKIHKKKTKDGRWYEVPSCWVTSDKRMLQMRARGFGLRDCFPHVLLGLYIAEEFVGSDEIEINPITRTIEALPSIENLEQPKLPEATSTADIVKQQLKSKLKVEKPVNVESTPSIVFSDEAPKAPTPINTHTIEHLNLLKEHNLEIKNKIDMYLSKNNLSGVEEIKQVRAERLIYVLEQQHPDIVSVWQEHLKRNDYQNYADLADQDLEGISHD